MTTGQTSSDPPPAIRRRVGLAGLRRGRGWESHPGVPPHRLSIGERAADSARNFVGSWPFLTLLAALVTAGIIVAVRHDAAAGPVAVLGLVLSGLALVGLSLVLRAARRADRTAAQVALYDLESDRRRAAAVDELRKDVEQLRGDLARLVARLEASSSPPRRTEEVRR